MNRNCLLAALLLVFAAGPAGVQGQEEVPPPVRPPHRILLQIEHRGPEAITAGDRRVIAERQEPLNTAISASGYDVQGGSWSYEQVVCPLFPSAILLSYSSDAGTTHGSRFVAVVPRGSGDAEIVSVLRGGNTRFKASYKNPATINIFNQLQSREGIAVRDPSMGQDDRWVKLALCYAELSGDHPTTLLTDTLYGEAYERNVNVPVRRVQPNGSIVFEFSDVNDPKATVQWDLAFDAHGQLTKVERAARPLNTPRRHVETQTELIPAPGSK
jgi:hypothetical protein